MLNRDSWDEALLGSEKKTPIPLIQTFLPGPTISKSLVPLAGLILALVAASGFELAGRVEVSKISFHLPVESFSLPTNNLTATALGAQLAARQFSEITLGGVKSFGHLVWSGYQSLGEVSLTALSQTSNLVSSEFSALGHWGIKNINQGGDKVVQSSLIMNQGLNVLTTAAVGESKTVLNLVGELPKTGGLVAASALASVGDWYGAVAGQLAWWLANTRDFLFAYGQEIGTRWRNFFGRKDVTTPVANTPVMVTIDNETKADLKDIKLGIADILKKLNQSGAMSTGGLPSQGMVVVPKVGSATPESLRAKVGGMFSDQVNVALDESGKAGVITPVFRRGVGEDYLFVLTPITP